jgi:hypothetical protein
MLTVRTILVSNNIRSIKQYVCEQTCTRSWAGINASDVKILRTYGRLIFVVCVSCTYHIFSGYYELKVENIRNVVAQERGFGIS